MLGYRLRRTKGAGNQLNRLLIAGTGDHKDGSILIDIKNGYLVVKDLGEGHHPLRRKPMHRQRLAAENNVISQAAFNKG